jgi:hypothetical protein
MKKIFFFTILVFLFSSCQKEVDGTLVGGGSTADYQPVSANSEWNYTSTSIGNYTLKSVGADTMINGRRYYKFDNISSQGSARAYIAKANGVYWQYGESPVGGVVLEQIYLKDSAIGTTWTNTISVGGFSNYHKYTVAAKDIQRTVNGKTFNNVIELTYQMSLDNPLGGVINAGGGKQFYAKGVGAIESFFTVGFLGFNISDTTRLTSYTIR